MDDEREELEHDRHEHDRHDDRPMLVLGESGPDVEDTTAEELARERAELEAQRGRLYEEDERRRELAEAKAQAAREEAEKTLAEERRLAELELARRQRAVDDAERKLAKTERRLERQASRARTADQIGPGSTGQAAPPAGPVQPRLASQASERRSLLTQTDPRTGVRVPRMRVSAALAVVASVLTLLAAAGALESPGQEQVEAFVAADESRTEWLAVTAALDVDVNRYLAGEDVTGADGSPTSVELAKAAAPRARTESQPERFLAAVEQPLSQPGSPPQRVLSDWVEARRVSGSYAAPSFVVNDARDALDTDDSWPAWMLGVALLSTGALAVGLARGGTKVGAGLAGLALLPMVLLLVHPERQLGIEPSLQAHELASRDVSGVVDQMRDDLEVVYGVRVLSAYERDGNYYWADDDPLWLRSEPGIPSTPPEHLGYLEARQSLVDVDERRLSTQDAVPFAAELIEAGNALLVAEQAQVEAAREVVLASTVRDGLTGGYLGVGALAVLLPLAALAPALVRQQGAGA